MNGVVEEAAQTLFGTVTGFFKSSWLKLVAAGVVLTILGGLVLFIRHQASDISDLTEATGALETQLTQAQQVNQHDVDVLAQTQATDKATIAALEREHVADTVLDEFSINLKDEVSHATPDKDGPVAPILAHVLASLRAEQKESADGAGAVPNGKTNSTKKLDGLRHGAAGARGH